MTPHLTERLWREYEQLGYLRLGSVLRGPELTALQGRMDEILSGHAGPKVQGLEVEPLVSAVVGRPLFREICERHYGLHAGISIFRAMVVASLSGGDGGSPPWHQYGGDSWKLDRDPLVTIWIALDDPGPASRGVQVIPGSHRLGLLTRNGSALTPEDVQRQCSEPSITHLELEAGDGLLLNNWLVHRSHDETSTSPRLLTTCFADARTRNVLTGDRYPVVWRGRQEAPPEWPFLEWLKDQSRHWRETALEAERYAKSLVEELQRLEQMHDEAERQARALAHELARARADTAPAAGLARLPGTRYR